MSATVKDDAEWLVHVKESLERDKMIVPETNSDVCIFGIAHPLLKVKPEAYIPQVISIGPYHHRKSQYYEESDSYKLKIASTMVRQLRGFSFNTLVQEIQQQELPIRACYDRNINYSGEVLSWMLALDASFLLQFLRSSYFPYTGNVESNFLPKQMDPILHSLRKTPLWYAIKNDILMLENQVPMFLLRKALYLTTTHGKAKYISRSDHGSEISQANGREGEGEQLTEILQAACLHFNPFTRDKNSLPLPPDLTRTRHILDYVHQYIIPSPDPIQSSNEPERKGAIKLFMQLFVKKPVRKMLSIPRGAVGGILNFIRMSIKITSTTTTGGSLPSATELNEAGVKFAASSSGDLRDIIFKRRRSTLFLPKITINDSTEVVLRNLVALALDMDTKEKPLTRYTYLMDRLIDTPRDVAVLKRYGVINSQMGCDTDVAQMWNSMSKLIQENAFDPVDKALEEANRYYRSKWRILLAEYIKTHCSKPWLVISVLSAGIMLLLTAIEVFCNFNDCQKY